MSADRLGAIAVDRIESLDYLRGLMAFSVMLYHFTGMGHEWKGADHVLGKLGFYAVSVFYVLSGVSLTIVYRERLNSGAEIASYALKRVFRIFPLYWLVVTLSVALRYAVAAVTGRSYDPDPAVLFLNYSLLFGFVRPEASVATGGWSIGNEMVFYALFPVIVYAASKWRAGLLLAGLPLLGCYVLFAYVILDAAKPLDGQFALYINPLNQAFLFASGIAVAWFLKPASIGWAAYPVLALLALVFYLFPASPDSISIVTGHERMALSVMCIAVVAVLYASGLRYSNRAGRALRGLGDLSYAVYLIHPLVAVSLILGAIKMGQPGTGVQMLYCLLLVGIPLTLFFSYCSYRLLETPMLKLGGRLAAAIASRTR